MKVQLLIVVALMVASSEAQFGGFRGGFRGFFRGVNQGVFQPMTHMFHHHVMQPVHHFVQRPQFHMPHFFGGQSEQFRGGKSVGNTRDKATEKPIATGHDTLYPEDCGRDDNNKGLLCFPDGLLCQNRLNNGGIENYRGHNYLFSWRSSDPSVSRANWDWFNARNYCRKRCMDLVSFESQDEYEWVKQRMGGVKYIWTSGRLCNFDGCDRPDFFPKEINGWFWSANQARLNPTNGTAFHDWSFTGGFNPPRKQPDNREKVQQGGEDEACLAVLNNFYGDGIKWHDVACHHEKPIVCEDTEGHLNFARQTFPNIRIP